jgi:rubrerythrin
MKNLILAALIGALVAAATLVGSAGASAGSTLENLQAAYNGESNASARYKAFAAKADAEGYQGVARLFRAASRSEAIHAGNHAAVIRSLGGTPVADLAAPAVKSTRENLRAAIGGESHERDTMYPEFIERARKDGKADAVRTLTQARVAEIEHAKLYQAALDGLEGQKVASAPIYVCPVCGFTAPTPPATCPGSGTAMERFDRID